MAGSRPVSSSTSRTSSTISARWSWRADRFTAMCSAGATTSWSSTSPCDTPPGAPTARRHDQTRLLGERDELQRWDQPTRGMLPAHERLDAGDGARLQLDHRLVVQDELVVLQCSLQVRLQLEPLERRVVHRRLEHLIAALAALLGHVHRHVRVPEQLLGALLRLRGPPSAIAMPMLARANTSLPSIAKGACRPRGCAARPRPRAVRPRPPRAGLRTRRRRAGPPCRRRAGRPGRGRPPREAIGRPPRVPWSR